MGRALFVSLHEAILPDRGVTGKWRCLMICLLLAISAKGHVVTQIFGELQKNHPWEIEVLFDAGYAVSEWRGDRASPAPSREWLMGLGESGWAPLRLEAERYLRESLILKCDGNPVSWKVAFIDFSKTPPDFPVLLNDGAYLRMRITTDSPELPTAIFWSDGPRPSFVLKLPGKNAGYLTLAPGQSLPFPSEVRPTGGHAAWIESFRQGFRHVLPLGLDHVLFVVGLFFYRRAWRPLLSQSLAFTLAHSVTLGLAAAGFVRVPGSWVEPAIALSVMAVAFENLRPIGKSTGATRLGIVFVFGLIHGLGFAGALSVWIKPGPGFLPALLSANLGVEAAQAALLVVAWCLTAGWHGTPTYRRVRLVGCLTITGIGAFWLVQRIG